MGRNLEDVLTEKQIHHILKQSIGEDVTWVLKGSDVRPAVAGIAGFLGDHMKAVLQVEVEGRVKVVHLFLKRIPIANESKAKYIAQCNFYKREAFMYKLLEEISDEGPDPWCVKAYLYTDSIIVMPDLSIEGYSIRHFLQTLDLEHILITATSLARLHAASVNYETKKSIELKRPHSIFQEYGDMLTEAQFVDGPWLRTCPKVSMKLLENFSTKSYHNLPELKSRLLQLYIQACDSLTEYQDTVNVILHKDPWVNNIMFKYENKKPINAALLDYQCVRYAPPAFDLLMLLYLTTDRSFREERENDIFNHYYSVFLKNLTNESKKKVISLGYDKGNFLSWCERGRMYGMIMAIALYPFILMDPKTAQKTFDDPETSEKYFLEDRSEPVIAHSNRCERYRTRNLAVTEEFVETYVLKNVCYFIEV